MKTAQTSVRVPTAMSAQTVKPAEAIPSGAFLTKRSTQLALLATAALLAIALLTVLAMSFSQLEPEGHMRRFSFTHEGLQGGRISPGGRYIAFVVVADGGA